MGSILGFLNIIFSQHIDHTVLDKVLGGSRGEDMVTSDIAERIEWLMDFQNVPLPSNGRSIIGSSASFDEGYLPVIAEVYRRLATIDTSSDLGEKVAYICLVSTQDKPVPLITAHYVNTIIQAHNRLGHPTKVKLLVTDLCELFIV